MNKKLHGNRSSFKGTDLEYWSHLAPPSRAKALPVSLFQGLFDRHLPKNENWSALEIGAFPGNNLAALSISHGYRPTALDFVEAVNQLPGRFKELGIDGLESVCADFFKWTSNRKFNVVMSLGFVEHFPDLEDTLSRHWALVDEGGFLLVSVPVFGPLQLALRKAILTREKFEESCAIHNLSVMRVSALKGVLRRFPGAREVEASYFGNMNTWFNFRQKFVRKTRWPLLAAWKLAALVPRALNRSSYFFSPMAAVIFTKESTKQPL